MNRALVTAVAVVGGLHAQGCLQECNKSADCNLGFNCSFDGRCVEGQTGDIEWVSPAPGATVDSVFTATFRVTFQGESARLHIDRGSKDPGDICAPFLPRDVVVEGKGLGETITTDVTVPGLLAVGEDFHIAATLLSTGEHSVEEELHGPPSGYDGARFDEPDEHVTDAAGHLTVPVSITFDRAAVRATLFTEPVKGDPTPRIIIGSGISFVHDQLVPVARGPEIIWLDLDDDSGATHRCGFGMIGDGDAAPGLELGLIYSGDVAGQLDLRLLVDREAPSVCSYLEPGTTCTALTETRAPTQFGEELLSVDTADGDVVQIAVVPGAASPPMIAMVRVSYDGEHIGYLGPVAINPELGESWLAGSVSVEGGVADVLRTDQIIEGVPF